MAVAGGWREAAAAPWGKGCCSPLSPEMGKPDVGGDVRDGVVSVGDPVVAGDPMERVGMLLADPPALSNSEGMGEQEGGEQISPATEGFGLCPAPFQAKYSGKGRAGAAHPRSSPFWLEKPFPPGLSLPMAVKGWELPLSGAHPPFSHCESAVSQGYQEGSRNSRRRKQFQTALSPAELIRAVLLADAPMATGDGGCGMRAGSDCSSAQPRGKRQLVPVCSQGGSRDGSGCPPSATWGEQGWVHGVLLWFSWLGSSFGTELSHQCQVSSWLGVSSLSRDGRCQHPLHTGDHGTNTPGAGRDGRQPCLCSGAGAGDIPGTPLLPPAPAGQDPWVP